MNQNGWNCGDQSDQKMQASLCYDQKNRSDDAEQEQAEAFVDYLMQNKGLRQRTQ